MYEELVKRLREESEIERWLQPHSANETPKLLDDAADAIEELSKPKWIPVTKRLPEDSWERVLAYTDDGTVMTLPAIKLRNGYVRYWMPLPEPPKEET